MAQIVRKVESFIEKWSPILDKQWRESGKRVELLRRLSCHLVRLRTEDEEDHSQFPGLINSVLDDLERTVDAAFKEKLIVGPREIVQV